MWFLWRHRLCVSLSWDPELPGEFRGRRLWDVSVFQQQLLWNPRSAPHLSHSAAQRRSLRLTGEQLHKSLTWFQTPDTRCLPLGLFCTNTHCVKPCPTAANARLRKDICRYLFLLHLIPSVITVICEECLLYKEQWIVMHGSAGYRTNWEGNWNERGNSLSTLLE